MSAHWPNRWTGRIAFVAGVTFARTRLGVEVERRRARCRRRRAWRPSRVTALAVAKNVKLGQDHLVARPDVQGHQGQQQGVAARGTADGVVGLAVVGDAPFQPSPRPVRARSAPLWQTRPAAAAIWSFSDACCRPRSNSGTPRAREILSIPF